MDAYLTVADALATDGRLAGEAINVSYEQPLSVLDFVVQTLAAVGRADLQPDVRNEVGAFLSR